MSGPIRARKTTPVDAYRYDGNNTADILSWADGNAYEAESQLFIMTDHGDLVAEPGDWVLRNATGEHYPVKHEVFDATYEPA